MRLLGVNDMILRERKSCTCTFLYHPHHDRGTPEQGLNLQCVLHLYSHSCRGVNVQNCPLRIKERFYKFQLVQNSTLAKNNLHYSLNLLQFI